MAKGDPIPGRRLDAPQYGLTADEAARLFGDVGRQLRDSMPTLLADGTIAPARRPSIARRIRWALTREQLDAFPQKWATGGTLFADAPGVEIIDRPARRYSPRLVRVTRSRAHLVTSSRVTPSSGRRP